MSAQKSVREEEVIAAFWTVGEWIGRLVLHRMESPAAPPPVQEQRPPAVMLNGNQAAEYLGVSISTFRRRRRSGQLTIIDVTGRAKRYPVEDLDRLIRDRIVRPRRQ